MTKNVDRTEEQIDLLRSLPLDEQPDKMDALWRQLMVFKTFTEGNLSETRSRRAEAEAARERAEQETVESTRRLYEMKRLAPLSRPMPRGLAPETPRKKRRKRPSVCWPMRLRRPTRS